jgi:hypothetical protein
MPSRCNRPTLSQPQLGLNGAAAGSAPAASARASSADELVRAPSEAAATIAASASAKSRCARVTGRAASLGAASERDSVGSPRLSYSHPRWYQLGTDCSIRCVRRVMRAGRMGRMGRERMHLDDLAPVRVRVSSFLMSGRPTRRAHPGEPTPSTTRAASTTLPQRFHTPSPSRR